MSNRPEVMLDSDSLGNLRDWLDAKGTKRILLLTGPSRRFADRVMSLLEGLSVEIFAGATAHVPQAVVVEAEQQLKATRADTLISLGGGATTGLGKALRRTSKVIFVAIPTTYAGSEMTNIYGVTNGRVKSTGRDESVLPDLVIYDPELTSQMPQRLTTTSLLNALAHPISALSTGSLSAATRQQALRSINTIYRALERLAESPRNEAARIQALEGMSLAARVLNEAEVGIHHKLVHLIGGSFRVEHSELHSVLLPHFVRSLFDTDKPLYKTVSSTTGNSDLPAALFDFLHDAKASTSLSELGIAVDDLEGVLTEHPELATPWIWDAVLGKRPSMALNNGD